MKRLTKLACALALALNAGCTPVLKEVRYTGGYPGYLLDKRTFDASGSKQLVLFRATLVLGMAAEMGRLTVKGEDADAFAKYLAAAATEINYAAADLYPLSTGKVCPTAIDDTSDCTGFYANFEGEMPMIETRLVRVVLAALPADRVRKFLDDAAKGDVLGATWNAARTVADAAGGLHFAAARYRGGVEMVAEAMGDRCKDAAIRPFKAESYTVREAARCLGLSEDALFSSPNEATRRELPAAIQRGAFVAVLRATAGACAALPYSGDVAAVLLAQTARAKDCAAIVFEPAERPVTPVVASAGTPAR